MNTKSQLIAAAAIVTFNSGCCSTTAAAESGIYTASLIQESSSSSSSVLQATINIFVTNEAINSNVLGYNGVIQGLPSDTASVRLVVHEQQGGCTGAAPLRLSTFRPFNFSIGVGSGGEARPVGTESFTYDDNNSNGEWRNRGVGLYLTNGTRVGCGRLSAVDDDDESTVIEVTANSFSKSQTTGGSTQAEVTGFVSPSTGLFCYFATLVGLPPLLPSGYCSTTRVPNQCGIQIRSQSSCEEEDLQQQQQPLVGGGDWNGSKYFWSNDDGFGAASACVDNVDSSSLFDTATSLLVYDPEGLPLACGAVQPYTPALLESQSNSNVYFAYLGTNRPGLQQFWGVVFVFRNTEAIRQGVVGIAGHLYGTDDVCVNATTACTLILSTRNSCEEVAGVTEKWRVGQLTADSSGSFYGTFDVSDQIDFEDEDVLAILRYPNGTVASCTYLEAATDSTVFQTKTLPFSDRTVTGEVVSTNAYENNLCSFGFVYGLDAGIEQCPGGCNYQVNNGKTCNDPGEAIVNEDFFSTNPWLAARYTSTNAQGVAMFGGCVDTRYQSFDYAGNVMVIRGPDNIASSCGIMEPFEPLGLKYNGVCDVCPFDGFDISKPEALVNLGGPFDVACKTIKESGELFLFSFDDCTNAQREAGKSCGCALGATERLSNRKPSRIIAGFVAAAVILAALGAACLVIRRRKKSKNLSGPESLRGSSDDVVDSSLQPRQDQHTALLFPHMHTAVAVAVPIEETNNATSPDDTLPPDKHGALTTKNQMRGDSFWMESGGTRTPYAAAVPVDHAGSLPPQRNGNEAPPPDPLPFGNENETDV